MRFLRWFVIIFLSLALIIGGGYFRLREIMLVWAEFRVESDIRMLQPVLHHISENQSLLPGLVDQTLVLQHLSYSPDQVWCVYVRSIDMQEHDQEIS